SVATTRWRCRWNGRSIGQLTHVFRLPTVAGRLSHGDTAPRSETAVVRPCNYHHQERGRTTSEKYSVGTPNGSCGREPSMNNLNRRVPVGWSSLLRRPGRRKSRPSTNWL